MTIQEAIKSGKPFRRKTWGKQYKKEWYTQRFSLKNELKGIFELGIETLSFRDILADDWEIKK